MTDIERIIDQVRRIRNLAENAGTEGEAAAAAAAMARLLSKYNLDLSDIPVGEEDDELDEPVDHETIQTQTKQSDYKWRELLLASIASYNFCRVLHTERWIAGAKRSCMIVVGKPHNREVVKFMYEIITEALVRMSKEVPTISEARKEELEFSKLIGQKPRYTFSPRRSFLYGAVEVITQRLREAHVEFRASSDRALVVVDMNRKDLDLYVSKQWPRTGTHRYQEDSRASLDRDGYEKGKAAGRSLQFQQGIGTGSHNVGTKSLGEGRR